MHIIGEKRIGAIVFLYGDEQEVERCLKSKGKVKSECLRIRGEGALDATEEICEVVVNHLQAKQATESLGHGFVPKQ